MKSIDVIVKDLNGNVKWESFGFQPRVFMSKDLAGICSSDTKWVLPGEANALNESIKSASEVIRQVKIVYEVPADANMVFIQDVNKPGDYIPINLKDSGASVAVKELKEKIKKLSRYDGCELELKNERGVVYEDDRNIVGFNQIIRLTVTKQKATAHRGSITSSIFGNYTIYITLETGERVSVDECKLDMTIASLKERLKTEHGISSYGLELCKADAILNDSKTLEDYNIGAQASLSLESLKIEFFSEEEARDTDKPVGIKEVESDGGYSNYIEVGLAFTALACLAYKEPKVRIPALIIACILGAAAAYVGRER